MPFDISALDDYPPERVRAFKQQALLNERATISTFRLSSGLVRSEWAPRDWPDPQLPPITDEGASIGPLIAEGDSWFDYLPGIDIIDHLRYRGYAFDVSYATAGDTLENMIYGTKHDSNYKRLPPQLDAVLARVKQVKPKVFLFSGGGNDVAGDEFAQYFNHASSGLEAFRRSFAEFHIGVVFKKYLDDLCFKVRQANPSTIILMHGYGHAPPTGKAVINAGPFRFVGPWLRPVLTAKNIVDPQEQRKIVFGVIDLYNKMLEEVQSDNPDNFCYVDLRSVINPDADWVNELHLSNSAFCRAAASIHEKLQSLT